MHGIWNFKNYTVKQFTLAVIKWTALVTQMKGKLRGSVLQMGSGGQIMRSNRGFNQLSNPRLSGTKVNVAATVYQWRALTPSQRSAWSAASPNYPTVDRYGNTHYSSAYTLYMRLNTPLNYHLGAPITVPTSPWSFSNLGTIAASVVPATPQVLITFASTYASSEYLLINATSPVSAGRKAPKSYYTKIGLYNNPGSFSQDITTDYTNRFGVLLDNAAYYFQIKLLSSTSGQLTPSYIASAYT
jgi:hypothetical protein